MVRCLFCSRGDREVAGRDLLVPWYVHNDWVENYTLARERSMLRLVCLSKPTMLLTQAAKHVARTSPQVSSRSSATARSALPARTLRSANYAATRRSGKFAVVMSAAAEAAPSLEGNILYDFSKTPAAPPPFDSVTADMVVPAMKQLLKDLEGELQAVESASEATWSGFSEPLEKIVDKLSSVWGVCTHLKATKDTEELRKAVEEVIPERVNFSLRLSQSKALYKLYEDVRNGPAWESLSEAQQRLIDSNLVEAKLQGVGLEGEAQEQFNKNQKELAQLSTTFSNNLLDATKAYKKFIEGPDCCKQRQGGCNS